MGRLAMLFAATAAVAACATQEPPRIVGNPPPGISYRFQGDDIAATNQRADRYCQQYGRHARLQTVQHSGSDNIAVYDCA